MFCKNHPEREAYGMCIGCGKFLCKECIQQVKNKNYCNQCIDNLFDSLEAQVNANKVSQNIHIIQQNNVPEMSVNRKKSPGLSTFLSFIICGAGQMYNGQLGKGLIFLILFIAGIISGQAYISFICFVWSMIDAHSTAKKINLGIIK